MGEPENQCKVRRTPDGAWRYACESQARPRDNMASALTLAFLRSVAADFA